MQKNRRPLYTYAFSVLFLLTISLCFDSLNPYLEAFGLVLSLGLGSAYILFRDRGRPVRIPKTLVLFGFYLLYFGFLTIRSPQPLPGLEKWAISILLFLAYFIVSDSLLSGWENKTWENALLNLAIVFSLLEIFLAGVWYFRWTSIAGSLFSVPPVSYRLYGLFIGHANVFSGYINLVLPIVVVRLIQSRKLGQRLQWGFVISIFMLVQYLASSRGGWISAVAGLVITGTLLFWPNIRAVLFQGRRIKLQRRTLSDMAIFATIVAVELAVGAVLFLQIRSTPGHGSITAPITASRTGIWMQSLEVISLSPIFGHGPGSFSTLFALVNQVPPGFSTSHAHNGLLQITAQSGLVGLVLISCAAVMLVKTIVSTFRNADRNERIRLSTYIGAGTAVAVHLLVDYLFESPAYAIGVLVLLALTLRQSRDRDNIVISPRKSIAVFLPLILLAIGAWTLASRGAFTYWRGISAARSGDFQGASENLCQAADTNPSFSLYSFQCGLALAYLNDQEHDLHNLQEAIDAYAHGLKIDPYWPPHRANYAAFLWAIGDKENALKELTLATESAPRQSVFHQNLGLWLETINQPEAAESEYLKALLSDASIADSEFFKMTPARINALASFIEGQSIPSTKPSLAKGWEYLEQGILPQAHTAFTNALDQNPLSVEAYRGLAQTALHMDKPAEAQKFIDTARFVGGGSTNVYFTAGEIALTQGDLPMAADLILQGFHQLFEQSSSWAFYGRTYGRFFPVPDLVPQLYRLNLNEKDLELVYTILDHLKEQGNSEEAQFIEMKLSQDGYVH